MHQINRQAIVKHPSRHMFDLVNDVKKYPLFLKWCHDAHIIESNNDRMIAGLTVSLAGFKQKFTTRNDLFEQQDECYRVNLSLVKGPFSQLNGHWLFTALGESASKIELYLAFNFQSGLLNNAFKKAFGAIAQQLVFDFVRRADDVYR